MAILGFMEQIQDFVEIALQVPACFAAQPMEVTKWRRMGRTGTDMPGEGLSDRQRVAELHESEARFRRLSALSADIYWEQNAELRFTSISSSSTASRVDRARAEAFLGKARWEADYVNMSAADWAAHRAVLEARQPFRDLELCRYDASGRKVWLRVSGEPVLDASGVFRGYQGIARDITERRRAEELRELEHAMTRILADAESASAALQSVIRAVCETEGWDCGRYFRVDKQAKLLRFAEGWGVPDPAVQRFVARSRELVYPPGAGLSGLAWQTGEPVWATDVAKDPRSSKVGANKIGSREIGIHGAFVFPIVSSGGTIGVLNFASRKPREPEEQLLQAITAIGAQIGQVLRRRQADEERQVLEAQLRQAQKMQAIGTLATGIAHEFNNVLRAILANVELARMDAGPEHPVRESIEEIDKASRRARDIVQRILAFARPQAAQRRRLCLVEVTKEAIHLLAPTLPAGIELSADFSADSPEILGDATQIHQLLLNLCTNAAQAMGGARGRITVRLSRVTAEPGDTAIPGLPPGAYARLSISDCGAGIDPAIRERVFEPFFTTKSNGEGTGLGLAIVHGIVRAHEGAIDLESEPGKGTTFHVCFPAMQPAAEQGAPADASARAPGRGRHVLFLDDNEALVSAMVRSLSRRGYRVSGYSAPEKALHALREAPQSYDVVVGDYIMPGLSGLDVAREVAAVRPDLPVVVFSGHIDEELRRRARELGVKQLLGKLDAPDELFEAIDRLTAGRPAA
jgi:PAS domain S-box-containing protein